MDDLSFETLLGQIGALSLLQRETLRGALSTASPTARELLEDKQAAAHRCAHCGGTHVGRWGQAHGLRRYRCRDCRRTYNALTGTALARLRHKSAWLAFSSALQQAVSVRKSAAACSVAVSTAFRWRHRFLAAPTADKPTQMSGIIEADETFFRRSYKGARHWTQPGKTAPPDRAARKRGAPTGRRGTPLDEQVPVLIVRDRQRTTSDAVLPDLTARTIGAHLGPLLNADALLCTDSARAYRVIARLTGIKHEPVNTAAGEHVRQRVFHIQNVNAYDSRLKGWMARFNGVATKYLPSYLGWRRMIETLDKTANPAAILLKCA